MKMRVVNPKIVHFAFAALAWLGMAYAVRSDTIKYNITEDTRIDSDVGSSHDKNYANDSLKMILNSQDHYGGTFVRVLIDLPDASLDAVSNAVADGSLSSAKLNLYLWWINVPTGYAFEDYGVVAHPLTRAFTETGATFTYYDGTNQWTTAGGDYDASKSVVWSASSSVGSDNAGWYSFDLTQLLGSGYDLSNGLVLMFDPETQPSTKNSWATYCFYESESGALGPNLEIVTVPEPAATTLLLIGSFAWTIIFYGKKRK